MSGDLGVLVLGTLPTTGLIYKHMPEAMMDIPLFQDLTPDQQELIEPLLEPYYCPPDTVIFEQGDRATHMYLILSGTVAIEYKPYDGPPIIITHLHKGDGFGWSAVTGSEHYTSKIIAEEEVDAVRIHGRDLRQLCLADPETGAIVLEKIAQIVSTRWKNAHTEVKEILERNMSENNMKRANGKPLARHTEEQQIRGLLQQLSAYVEQFHGGAVEFVSLEGTVLTVKLGGACIGCPLSPSTLHGWVAGTIRQFFPDIVVVSTE